MADAKKVWGGRFNESPDETFAEFNNSFRFDRRLFAADVRASIAHANGLKRSGILSTEEAETIVGGLTQLLTDAVLGSHFFDSSDAEDVHSFIEQKLVEAIGETGLKLHTGRSRNDQVATAFRLWLREEIEQIDGLTRELQSAILDTATGYKHAVMPGYTHLQRAQPVLFAHWCLAYFEMLRRDRRRFADAFVRVNVMPLGAGALAGAGFPIDRNLVAEELGFTAIAANSLDAVSDRDFAIEFAGVCSLLMMHLSRLAEDVILYCSQEFGFFVLSDAISTGSSLMPQKKNPDSLELIRGKAGRVFGHHTGLLTTMKGLPLAYNKDMQEDKEAVFDTVDTVKMCLSVAGIVFENITLSENRMSEAAASGYMNATELADYLVRKGVAFRTAHELTGKIVLRAIELGVELHEMPIEEMRKICGDVEEDVFAALELQHTIASKSLAGGTSPEQVFKALDEARSYLDR
jgi:argininosuccinate lyase